MFFTFWIKIIYKNLHDNQNYVIIIDKTVMKGAAMASIFDLFRKIEKKSGSAGAPEYLVAGLGNPGREYARTRHNVGFAAIDFICREYGVECRPLKFSAYGADIYVGGHRVLLIKPTTFMNNSGRAVREASSFYKIPPEKIVVFCDDVNFDPGKMRIREKGSDGGHNGLGSIIEQLSSDAFPRVKIGVGKKPSPDTDLASWVLGNIPKADQKVFFESIKNAYEAMKLILEGNTETAMSLYN